MPVSKFASAKQLLQLVRGAGIADRDKQLTTVTDKGYKLPR